MSNPDLASWYRGVSIEIKGNTPKEKIIQHGEPMVYGITIPDNSTNKEAAREFIRFVLSEKGMKIIRNNYQTPLFPPELSDVST
jgi:ABC-type molybdate transport system substrate-binding protein